MIDPEAPSGDVRVTARCAACQGRLPAGLARPVGLTPCRQPAYRRRQQPAGADTQLPARRPRRDGTVYAGAGCQSRCLGEGPCQGLGNGQ